VIYFAWARAPLDLKFLYKPDLVSLKKDKINYKIKYCTIPAFMLIFSEQIFSFFRSGGLLNQNDLIISGIGCENPNLLGGLFNSFHTIKHSNSTWREKNAG